MTPLPDKKYMQQTTRSRVGVDDFDIYQHTGGRNHPVNRANDERFNNRNMQPGPDGRPVDVNHSTEHKSINGNTYTWGGGSSWKQVRQPVFKAGTPTDPAYYRPKTEKPAPVTPSVPPSVPAPRYANNEYAKAQAAAGNPSAQLALAGLEASQIKFGNIQQGLKGLRSTPQNDKQMRGPKLSEGGYGLPPNPYSSYSTMASAQSGGQFSLPRRPLPAPSRPTTGRDIDPGFYKPMPKKPAPVTSTVPPSVPAPSNLGQTPIYKRRNKAQNGMITNLI